MTNIRLSIIIPFYNVEKYIAECLDSVYNQDIPEEEYEVICVNDASPDHSRDIVLEYQKKHSNLILVEHEMNKKLGAARNTGRRVAHGKYIWNVDSDDMIEANCLGKVLKKCEENDIDVFLFRNKTLQGDKLLSSTSVLWDESVGVVNGFAFWKQQGLKHQSEISPVWLMLLRRDYLNERDIYSPQINMNEDVPYTYKSILLSKHLLVTNAQYYITRLNDASLTAQFVRNVSIERLFEDMILSNRELYATSQQIPKREKKIRKSIYNVIQYEFVTDLNLIQRMDIHLRKQYAKTMRSNFRHVCFLFSVLSRRQSLQLLKLLLG